jgi:hypothetical protein
MFQYLQDKVPGLSITPSYKLPGGSYAVYWPLPELTKNVVKFYVDEVPVDQEVVLSLAVSSVALVKAFRPGFNGALGAGPHGVIAIYTKRGGDETTSDANNKGLGRAIVAGYSAPKEFYSPNYQENSPENEQEDLRTTLYWQPFILTGKDQRRVTIDFFNNDISQKLRIVLEGFNEDGQLAHIEKIIE